MKCILVKQGETNVFECLLVKPCGIEQIQPLRLTLDDGEEDDDDKEEKRDVKENAFHLKIISSRVLNLVTDTPACTHSYIHVEHVALKEETFFIYCIQ